MATKVKVINVCFPDGIGAGAPMIRALADAKINLAAFCGYSMGPEATLTFVVEPGKEADAKKALKKPGHDVKTFDGICVELSNKPGALAAVTEKLAAANVNVNYAYATVAGKKAAVVLMVSSPAMALKALA